MVSNISQLKNYLIYLQFINQEGKMDINLLIHEAQHYWKDHKKVVIGVAALIVILAIL